MQARCAQSGLDQEGFTQKRNLCRAWTGGCAQRLQQKDKKEKPEELMLDSL
jgi:hypothetical protein